MKTSEKKTIAYCIQKHTRFSITKNISKDSKKILYGLIEDQFKHFIYYSPNS